mmetsp:Transcript_47815/g.144603  ORF Transcript_47815/g.144603 Transcript_47815/m.144603 type:complete len:205 (-) Transcript_47815:2449-3063(-)
MRSGVVPCQLLESARRHYSLSSPCSFYTLALVPLIAPPEEVPCMTRLRCRRRCLREEQGTGARASILLPEDGERCDVGARAEERGGGGGPLTRAHHERERLAENGGYLTMISRRTKNFFRCMSAAAAHPRRQLPWPSRRTRSNGASFPRWGDLIGTVALSKMQRDRTLLNTLGQLQQINIQGAKGDTNQMLLLWGGGQENWGKS